MDFRSGNKIKIEGGMSSMTDLVFLLLIFFIVISTMITAGINIDVPKNGGKSSNKKILSININDKNEYFINKYDDFSKLDWKDTIRGFHLPDEEMNKNLENFTNQVIN